MTTTIDFDNAKLFLNPISIGDETTSAPEAGTIAIGRSVKGGQEFNIMIGEGAGSSSSGGRSVGIGRLALASESSS